MISLEWVVTGVLLFGGMIAGAVSLYVRRKREEKMAFDKTNEFKI